MHTPLQRRGRRRGKSVSCSCSCLRRSCEPLNHLSTVLLVASRVISTFTTYITCGSIFNNMCNGYINTHWDLLGQGVPVIHTIVEARSAAPASRLCPHRPILLIELRFRSAGEGMNDSLGVFISLQSRVRGTPLPLRWIQDRMAGESMLS